MKRFASVILDADSTLASLEGIDWLAGRRGSDVEQEVASLTDQAMAGLVPLESVYSRRLGVIRPTVADLEALGQAYLRAQEPDVAAVIGALRARGVALRVVSGGLRGALLPLTRRLGFDDSDVHAVALAHTPDGRFQAVLPSPLTTQEGKEGVAASMALPSPVLAVGDGATDLAMRPAVDAFAAYVGVVRRPAVAAGADFIITSFRELEALVFEAA